MTRQQIQSRKEHLLNDLAEVQRLIKVIPQREALRAVLVCGKYMCEYCGESYIYTLTKGNMQFSEQHKDDCPVVEAAQAMWGEHL